MNKKAFLSIVLALIIIAIAWVVLRERELNSAPDSKDNLIRVTTPKPNDEIESPLTIEGEARGFWYFEASFPVKLLDAEGNVIVQTPMQADGEWMTEDFVPFHGTLTFEAPRTETGILVLEKDNPSGLPEHADELRIPLRFKTTAPAETMTLKTFFGKRGVAECEVVVPVTRELPKTTAVARAAITELLKGPSDFEKSAGYTTAIPDGVTIQSLTITNGVAKIDFSEKLEEGAGGSCRVTAIRAQITETLKQFPTITSVVISIDGRTEDILQP